MRAAAVLVHAGAGSVALVLGVWLLARAGRQRPLSGFPAYYSAVVLMAVALLAAVALDWGELRVPTRVAFVALCVLGGTMVWEADRARRFRGRRGAPMSLARAGAFVEAVGFTVIALVVGFAIITALDVGAPSWLVAAVGGLVVVVLRPLVAATRSHAQRRRGSYPAGMSEERDNEPVEPATSAPLEVDPRDLEDVEPASSGAEADRERADG
jgi:hypothetical protein